MKAVLKVTVLVVLVMSLLQMPSSASKSGAALLDCTDPVQMELCVPCDPENPEAGLCDPICIELPNDPECLAATTTFVITTTLPPTTLPPTTLPTLPTTTTIPSICLEDPTDPICPPQVVDTEELITQFPTLADGEGDIPPGTLDDNTIITDNGVGALVPTTVKMGVFAEGHNAVGAGQQLYINVLADGTIHLSDVGDEAADNNLAPRVSNRSAASDSSSSSSSSSADASCSDAANSRSGFKAKAPLKWRIRKRSIPGSLSKRGATRAIKQGANNVDDVYTRCSVDRSGISLDAVYKGKTLNKANLDSSGNCLSPNGKNVVDFSTLPVAGRTCSWYAMDGSMYTLVESDIRFNKNQGWTLKPSGGCARKLDLAGTATHEFGHAFGLAHVSTDHGSLTMTELLPLCSSGPRTLGRGDIKGLQAIY